MSDVRVRHLNTSIQEAVAQESMKARVAKLEASLDYLAMMSDIDLASDSGMEGEGVEPNG